LPENVLQELGIQRKIRLRLRHVSVLPQVLIRSDLLVILPSQIAEMFVAGGQLKMFELPFPVPPFTVRLHRQERTGDSTAQRWFHETIVEACVRSEVIFAIRWSGGLDTTPLSRRALETIVSRTRFARAIVHAVLQQRRYELGRRRIRGIALLVSATPSPSS